MTTYYYFGNLISLLGFKDTSGYDVLNSETAWWYKELNKRYKTYYIACAVNWYGWDR